jgi:glycine cleavage system aminomethyltransferase T
MGLEVGGDKLAPGEQALEIAGDRVGEVVAGFRSANLGRNLAYAWVDAPHFKDGTSVTLNVDGTETQATVVEMPFYDPEGRRMRL